MYTGTDLPTKIQNFTSRQKKIIIPTRPNIHKTTNKSKTTKHQESKNLVTTHRTIKNKIKNSNNSNINIQNNNSTDNSQNDRRYGNHRHNKNNDIRREKQSMKEEEYDSRIFRHLRSIESRIKKYSKQKNKNIQEQTGTQHHQNRKHHASKKTRPPKSQKTPKIYFSHVPKYCSTNIETVDPSTFLSLFHEEITPLDDPT